MWPRLLRYFGEEEGIGGGDGDNGHTLGSGRRVSDSVGSGGDRYKGGGYGGTDGVVGDGLGAGAGDGGTLGGATMER